MAKEEEAEAAEKASAMEMAEAFRAKYEKYVPGKSGGGAAAEEAAAEVMAPCHPSCKTR